MSTPGFPPPPYNEITGLYIQIDKHVNDGLFTAQPGSVPYNGNARPGQLIVDTTDYNLYIGNDSGNVRLVGPSLTQSTVDDSTVVLDFSNQNQQMLLLNGGFVKVPTDAQVALPIGFAVTLVTGDSNNGYVGVTSNTLAVYISGQDVDPLGSNGSSDQAVLPKYSMFALLKTGTNTWVLSGPSITENYC